MEEWKRLEFQYAKQLRECSAAERRALYCEAYSAVSELFMQSYTDTNPEERTAGTSKTLVTLLSQMVDKNDDVLEIGCGRGYTCLTLAPYVKEMVGIDVSEPSITESKEVLSRAKLTNVQIKHVSALELTDYFSNNKFSVCISIDVVEHLHPEDAKEHIQQVFHVLKPGGRYILVMPNWLTGPHDITKQELPEAKEPLGFHLNESTYREMTKIMREVGFDKFEVFYPVRLPKKGIKLIFLPYQFTIISEILYEKVSKLFCPHLLERIIGLIRLIAYKPNC